MTGFNIINKSTDLIEVSITKQSHPNGEDGWYKLLPGASSKWTRNGWETVAVRDPKDPNYTRKGWYLDCTSKTVNVGFTDFQLEVEIDWPRAGFNIMNGTTTPVRAFVTINGGAHERFFDVPSDYSNMSKSLWARKGWETLVFMDSKTKQRQGWYLSPEDGIVNIVFHGFNQQLGVSAACEFVS
ncbi:hypothetical protein D9613_008498 [Agrocybe pediades]|uniref:Uncharacterized protein n=1 Tax=Agrocybe pediades TaxID=84607 RepID=A0A8H4VP44_9AGAR|nr:hypothetical protein D9613_008498 [Agrocybe pediades]